MRRIKIIVLLCIMFLLTGCSGTYNLNINKNLSVIESIDLVIPSKEDTYDNIVKLFDENKIDHKKYKIVSSKDIIKVNYSEEYVSVEDYIVNSKIYKLFFDDIVLEKNNKELRIQSEGVFDLSGNNSPFVNNNFDISLLQVNIHTPYKVTNNNADIKSDDVISWVFNKDTTKKEINFTINTDNKRNAYIYVIPIVSIMIIAIVFISFILSRFNKSSKI